MVLVFVGLGFAAIQGHAQESTIGTGVAEQPPLPPPLDLPLMVPEAVPETANFFSAAHVDEWPPLPFNPLAGYLDVPVYSLAEALGNTSGAPFYLIDDRAYYLAKEQAEKAQQTWQMAERAAKGMDLEEASAPQIAARGLIPLSDDLLLDIEDATNGVVSLTVLNPTSMTNSPVWDLYATTNLSLSTESGALNATNWTWLVRTGPGETNVTTPMLSETECYFRLADTNDTDGDSLSDVFELLASHSSPDSNDTDGDGLLDGWSWTHFGHATGLESDHTGATNDYDGDGASNLDEQTAGTDPNTISFTLSAANQYVRANPAPLLARVVTGIPFKVVALVDSTNFASAIWVDYSSSNLAVNLGAAEGWHDVAVGLRGHDETAGQAWQWMRMKLDTVPPTLTITSPGFTTSLPMIQVQGISGEALSSITYDLGALTNQGVLVLDQYYDTNTWEFTTNAFQAFDLDLAPGTNIVTLRAVDLAGNVTATNFTFTMAADTNAPALSLAWPRPGMRLSGSSFTVRGTMDDPTAQITATVIDTNNVTNVVVGVVERDGAFWIEDVPLHGGTNSVTLTAVDVWTNVTTTNLSVVKANVVLGVVPVPSEQLWGGCVSVSGTVSDTNYAVWVNGVVATVNPDGTWTAACVRFGSSGTASASATAYPPGEEPSEPGGGGSEGGGDGENPDSPNSVNTQLNQEKPARLFVASDTQMETDHLDSQSESWDFEGNLVDWSDGYWNHAYSHNWTDGGGGTGEETEQSYVDDPFGTDYYWMQATLSWSASFWPVLSNGTRMQTGTDGPSTNVIGPPAIGNEHCDIESDLTYDHSGPWSGGTGQTHARKHYSRHAEQVMKLFTGGRNMAKAASLWGLSATATEIHDFFTLMPPLHTTITEGIAPERITIGSFGKQDANAILYAEAPKGVKVDVTAKTDGVKHYTRNTSASEVNLLSLTVVSNAVNVGSTNWAAVKATNEYVIIQATLSVSDTNAANHIKWSGGEAVPGNPFQHRVSKATSAETPVIATLGTNTLGVDVWILWADIEILTSGNNPPNAPEFPSQWGGAELGIQQTSDTNILAGKICAVATVSPQNCHSVVSNGWLFFQFKWTSSFSDGANLPSSSFPPWAADPTPATTTLDGYDKLYLIDGPNLPNIGTSTEVYKNFFDCVAWNFEPCSTTNNFWHFEGRWKADQTPQITLTNLGLGTIAIPTNAYYPAP
jgi:hypothetical protein